MQRANIFSHLLFVKVDIYFYLNLTVVNSVAIFIPPKNPFPA